MGNSDFVRNLQTLPLCCLQQLICCIVKLKLHSRDQAPLNLGCLNIPKHKQTTCLSRCQHGIYLKAMNLQSSVTELQQLEAALKIKLELDLWEVSLFTNLQQDFIGCCHGYPLQLMSSTGSHVVFVISTQLMPANRRLYLYV